MRTAHAGLPALQAMLRAVDNGRFPHAVLIQGESLPALEDACNELAAQLLKTPAADGHPDFHTLRPTDRMRRIGVDPVRELSRRLSQSSNRGGAKCVRVLEAERMSVQAANAFLKTLEEPPPETYLFLLSERPYDLLPTIRSRCLNLRIPTLRAAVGIAGWHDWLKDYQSWMHSLASGKPTRSGAADWVMTLYGLVCRYTEMIGQGHKDALTRHPEAGNEALTKEQREALEVLIKKGVRDRLWADIEAATRDFSLTNPSAPMAAELCQAVRALEQCAGLLEVNFAEAAALEAFLLQSMRIWGSVKPSA